MKVVSEPGALRKIVQNWRSQGERIAFVPTMGNLHQGHLALVEKAKTLAERCVVSIFVNPAQFGPHEDFQSYPRTLQQDQTYLIEAKVDLLFVPDVHAIYPSGKMRSYVEVPELSEILCGKFRPGHFRGVATVVQILFHRVEADLAVFGEKDYQQLLVIKRMVADLGLPLEIISVATFREKDGLAMSSRNRYLDESQRGKAGLLYKNLISMKKKIEEGELDFVKLQNDALNALTQAGFRSDYIEVRHNADLGIAMANEPKRILGAAWLGDCRLIDNVFCE